MVIRSTLQVAQVWRLNRLVIVHAHNRNLHLNNVLYVQQASKSLVSVHKLASDNNVFLEFHPNYFFIKDRETKRVLLQGRCEGGLYPLKPFPQNKRMLASVKLSSSLWHNRLGHPSSSIVQQIINKNKLPVASESNDKHVCDACQQGKSHQLPYAPIF